jgi:WD40 repeat protein
MSRHDAANTGSSVVTVDPTLSARAWTFHLTRHVRGYRPGMTVWSSAAAGKVHDRAVVAAGSYDHNVYLFDAASGEKIWRFTTGNGVYTAPLIWNDGDTPWLFVASSDRLLYGLDADLGSRRWSHAIAKYESTIGGCRLSSPCLGTVKGEPALFVGHWVWDKSLAHNQQAGGLTAVAARTGKRLWQTGFLDNRVSAPLFARAGDRAYVFVASEDGNLRALDADSGRVLWHHRETEAIMASPLFQDVPDGPRVIIGSHFGKLRSLDAATGREIWSFKTGNWITGTAALVRQGQRDLVVFGSYDQKLYALDALSGERVWSHNAAGPIYSSPAVVPGDPDPVVVYTAWDHQMYGLSARDGTQLWSVFMGEPLWKAIPLGESNWASPIASRINERWMLYFGSYNGVFYAIPLGQAQGAGGSPPWTTWRFWLTMILAMGFTGALAYWLDRKRRSHRASR